uniref:Elicitin-like protein n=1 Tax=Phytophthora ramorum TaxID=164328 RepID=H3GXX5_PHYRM
MRRKQLFTSWLLVVATPLFSHGVASGSSYGVRGYTSNQSLVAAGVAMVDTGSSDAGAFSSGSASASSSVTFPESTLVIASSVTEQPPSTTHAPAETPTAVPTTTTTPAATSLNTVESESSSGSQFSESGPSYDSESSSSPRSDESSAATSDTPQSAQATRAPIVVASPTSASASSDSSFGSTTTTSSGSSPLTETNSGSGEASIAKPSSESSTFQTVESEECSNTEVNNIYTLYSNCRSAFDLCVSASDYQIFPYQGNHPTQAQIQGMAESDACIAMFIIVIEANFSACTIGGMPLVSVVETLLKISVDLEESPNDEVPSAEEFLELLVWRYEVDLAKAAGVPHDGSSELYAEFETNLDAAIKNTAIRVNEDLTVDVRLSNGSYETFEDAIDLVVTDASAADLMPGYVVASSEAGVSSGSSSSRDKAGTTIESSSAIVDCTQNLWSLAVAVVASAFLLVEDTRRRV